MCKLSSTVLKLKDGRFLDHALDRERYVASEMPQAFRFELVRRAYELVCAASTPD